MQFTARICKEALRREECLAYKIKWKSDDNSLGKRMSIGHKSKANKIYRGQYWQCHYQCYPEEMKFQ